MTTEEKGKLLQQKLDSDLESVFTAVNKIYAANLRRAVDLGMSPDTLPNDKRIEGESMRGGGTHVDDWERGYAKGYARALQQVLSLTEGTPVHLTVDCIVDKLRREVLHAD